MKKRFASAGLAAGLLAGGAAGLALGVTSISSATSSSPAVNVVDDPAATDPTTTDDATGTDESADRPARGAWLEEALQPLIADGTITQAQADAVISALQDARPEGRPGGPGMGRGMGHGRIGHGIEAAATALGMTSDELRTALRNGQTIAEVAAEKGVDIQTVIDAMAAELKTHLDEEVAAGELTQEEADAKLADAIERITERLDGTEGS
jgi:hypothetical protein